MRGRENKRGRDGDERESMRERGRDTDMKRERERNE